MRRDYFQMGQFVLIAWQDFTKLSKIKVLQAVIMQGIAIGYGFYSASLVGLYLGFLISNLVTGFLFNKSLWQYRRRLRLSSLKKVAQQYYKFPAVNAPTTLISSLAGQLPMLMLSRYAGPEFLGFYAFAVRLMDGPANVLSQSVGQVYIKAASDAYHSGAQVLYKTYYNTVQKMALVGFIPVLAALFLSPWIVELVFGSEWKPSGRMVQILIIMWYVRFIARPISITYSVVDRQEFTTYLIVTYIVLQFIGMYWFRENPIYMLIGLSVAGVLFYAVYIVAIHFILKKQIEKDKVQKTR